MTPNLSETEVKILGALQENPRISVSDLSTVAGVSRPTVNKILTSLMGDERILLSSGINAKTHKYKIANVGINVTTPDSRAKIIEILGKCPKVLNIYRTTAQANILVTLFGLDEQSITSTVNCINDIEQVEVRYSNSLGTPLKDSAIPIQTGDNSNTPCGRNCFECSSLENDWCSGCFTFGK